MKSACCIHEFVIQIVPRALPNRLCTIRLIEFIVLITKQCTCEDYFANFIRKGYLPSFIILTESSTRI